MELIMDPVVNVLTEHYQRSYEVTYKLWRQRNRIFLILLAVIAVAALMTVSPSGAHPLLLDYLLKSLGVTDPAEVASMQRSFPFQLVDSIVLLGVFYTMVNLYHRASSVLRGYAYLAAMEIEIRGRLGLDAKSLSFTREGGFYQVCRTPGLKTVKYAYALLLGLLLIGFLVGRVRYDLTSQSGWPFFVFDSLTCLLTLGYYGAYASSSMRWDKAAPKPGGEKKQS